MALGALAMAACARQPSEPLRIGLSSSPAYELLYLADVQGLFAAEGVRVRLVEFASLRDARRAFERGQLDGMASTLVELLQARDHSPRSPQAVLVIDSSEGGDAIVAHHSVRSVADLRGRTIAAEPGSVGTYLLGRALETVGASIDDVTLLPMDQDNMPIAFSRRVIDAAVAFPPIAEELKDAYGARVLFTSADVRGEILDVLAIDETVRSARGDDVQAMVRGFHRAVEYAAAHAEDATRIMAARERVTPAAFAAALRDQIRVPRESEQAALLAAGGPAERAIKSVDRLLRATGQIDGPERTAGCIASPELATASAR